MASDAQILSVIQYCFGRMPTNTNDACAAFCNEVVHQLRDSNLELAAGLIAKSAGQEHGVGADGQRYAVDAIWVAVPTRSADILISAPSASQPWLLWYVGEQLPPSDSYRAPYGARRLPLIGTSTPPPDPDPDPDPEPPPGAVCEECKLVLERLEVLIEQAFRQTTALTTIAEIAEQLRETFRRQADGALRVASQVENRVKIGW